MVAGLVVKVTGIDGSPVPPASVLVTVIEYSVDGATPSMTAEVAGPVTVADNGSPVVGVAVTVLVVMGAFGAVQLTFKASSVWDAVTAVGAPGTGTVRYRGRCNTSCFRPCSSRGAR